MTATQSKINPQKLIPSIRAAQLSGYSQDYVGQLCRSGSIECKRVMGEWRVDLESLLAYKRRFNPDFEPKDGIDVSTDDTLMPTPLGHKDVFTKGGVEYLSSAEASNITGYSQDYIGQLARSGAVPAEKVGRKWFVAKADLLEHKKHNDSLLVAVQEKSLGVKKPFVESGSNDRSTVLTNQIKITKKLPQVIYKRDDGSTIAPPSSLRDSLSQGQLYAQTESHKTTPAVKVMDLRHTRYKPKNKAISDNIKRDTSIMFNNANTVKETSHVAVFIKILLILITVLELVIIVCMLLIPDVMAEFIGPIFAKNLIVNTLVNWLSVVPYIDNIVEFSKG